MISFQKLQVCDKAVAVWGPAYARMRGIKSCGQSFTSQSIKPTDVEKLLWANWRRRCDRSKEVWRISAEALVLVVFKVDMFVFSVVELMSVLWNPFFIVSFLSNEPKFFVFLDCVGRDWSTVAAARSVFDIVARFLRERNFWNEIWTRVNEFWISFRFFFRAAFALQAMTLDRLR